MDANALLISLLANLSNESIDRDKAICDLAQLTEWMKSGGKPPYVLNMATTVHMYAVGER